MAPEQKLGIRAQKNIMKYGNARGEGNNKAESGRMSWMWVVCWCARRCITWKKVPQCDQRENRLKSDAFVWYSHIKHLSPAFTSSLARGQACCVWSGFQTGLQKWTEAKGGQASQSPAEYIQPGWSLQPAAEWVICCKKEVGSQNCMVIQYILAVYLHPNPSTPRLNGICSLTSRRYLAHLWMLSHKE